MWETPLERWSEVGEFFLSLVMVFFEVTLFEVADLQFCTCLEVTAKAEEVVAPGVGSRR